MDVSVCEDLSLCWRQQPAYVRFPSDPAHRAVDRGSGATIHRTAGRAGTDSTEAAAVKAGRCIETAAVAADKASTEADKATVALVAAAGAAAGCVDPVAGCADPVAGCVGPVAAGMHLQSRRRSLLKTRISGARSSPRRTGS